MDHEYCRCDEYHYNPDESPRLRPRFDSGPKRTETTKCRICHKPTKEGKEYCPEHLDQSPHVRNLLERLARMEVEDEIAKKPRLSKKDKEKLSLSENLDEVVRVLREGPKTVEALARSLNKDTAVIDNYVKMLVSRGIVKTGKTKRGSTTVRIVNELL